MTSKTAKTGLGFLRLVAICNVLNIVLYFIALIFISGRDVHGVAAYAVFDLALNVVCMGQVTWLILNRKRYTRQIAIGMYALSIASSLVALWLQGSWSVAGVVGTCLFPMLLILYFAFSKRAKTVLVEPFDLRFRDKEASAGKQMWNPRSSDFWLRLLIYFFVFSVAGHWMEMGVQVLVVNGLMPGTVAGADSLTWRDSFNPFFIYGIAVAICGLALYPVYMTLRQKMPRVWQAYLVSFLINTAFCVVAELILGFLFNADHHAWDYSNQFMNFEGQICLLYTICFGVASSVITWLVYPLMERQFSYVSHEAFRFIFVGSLVLFLFILFTFNFDPYDLWISKR